MLLISGGGACSPVWADLVSALVPTHRVLALDVPGDAGMSASPTHKPRNPAEVAHWLEEVLSALALEHAVVVGHSYGAWLALTHAIHHPDRLKHLVLVDPTDCFARPARTYLVHALPLFLAPSTSRRRGFPELGNRWSRNRPGRHRAVGRPGTPRGAAAPDPAISGRTRGATSTGQRPACRTQPSPRRRRSRPTRANPHTWCRDQHPGRSQPPRHPHRTPRTARHTATPDHHRRPLTTGCRASGSALTRRRVQRATSRGPSSESFPVGDWVPVTGSWCSGSPDRAERWAARGR